MVVTTIEFVAALKLHYSNSKSAVGFANHERASVGLHMVMPLCVEAGYLNQRIGVVDVHATTSQTNQGSNR